MHFKTVTLAALASLAAAQSGGSNETLTQALNSTSNLTSLYTLVSQNPSLLATLGNLSNITVLAPNNDALSQYLQNSSVSSNMSTAVEALLTYHVLNGTYMNFSSMPEFIGTALMSNMYSNVTGGQVVEARNSTIFSGLRANSSIVGSSVNFTGGVVHIIDKVLTIPENIADTALAFGLTSFYGAASNASLVNALDDASDVTVFVPNNAAFQSIGSALPNLTTQQLASILEYHVINGTIAYSSMLSNESVKTMQGNNVTITVLNSTSVYVNNARVVIPDVLVANGVVHVIDEVLNPNNSTGPSGSGSSGEPAFSGASSTSVAPYTSGVPSAPTTVDTSSAAAGATATSSSSKGGAWAPAPTNAIGAAALGGLALIMQL